MDKSPAIPLRLCNRTIGFFRCSAMNATRRSLCSLAWALAAITEHTQRHQEQIDEIE